MKTLTTSLLAGVCALTCTAAASAASLDDKPKAIAWQGDKHKQSVNYVDNGADGVALRASWRQGSRRLIEIMFPDQPALEQWQPGMDYTVWVHDQPEGKVRAAAIRLVDASGEVFQFGRRLSEGEGWQEHTWTLDPAKAESVYGGDGNKKLDGQPKLFGMLAITEGEPDGPVHLWISPSEGGEVKADAPAQQAAAEKSPPAAGNGKAAQSPLLGMRVVGVETTEVVADLAQAKAAPFRGKQKKQTSSVAAEAGPDGTPALELKWESDAPPLMEVPFPGKAELLAFDAGVVVEVPVNADNLKGFSKAALRVRDRNGETFQFPIRFDPDTKGWQSQKLLLTEANAETHYGGGEPGKGKIDEPAQLSTMILLAPQESIPGSVLVGPIRRNTFNPDDIAAATRMASVKLDMPRQANIPLVRKDKDEPVRVTIKNDGQAEASFDLELLFEHFDGSTEKWNKGGIVLAGGESMQIEAVDAISKSGWYAMTPILAAEGDRVEKPTIAFLHIDPAGAREHPPAEGFWLGLDARLGNLKRDEWQAELAAMLGSDYLRLGNTWPKVERQKGKINWSALDAEIELMARHGLAGLYAFTFTPGWAVREGALEDLQRRIDEQNLGIKPKNAAVQEPDLEAWRNFTHAAAKHLSDKPVIAYEVWNEPDLSGFYQGTTDHFLKMMDIAHEAVEQHHPEAVMLGAGIATVGGHGGHNLNPDLIDRTIVEAQDDYEAIAMHQHGHFDNFVAGIDGRLGMLRSKLTEDKPVWYTETGVPMGGGMLTPGRRLQAQELVKKITFARARGAIGFTWFVMVMGHEDVYALVTAGGEPQPYPQAAAFNEVAKQMRGRVFVQQHDVGTGAWVLEFAGDNDRLVVMWAQSDAAVGQSVVMSVPGGAGAQHIDIMGNASPIPSDNGLAEIKLERDVKYIVIGDKAGEVVGSLASFQGDAVGEPGKQIDLTVTLSNPTSSAATYKLDWSVTGNPDQSETVNVPANGQKRHAVTVRVPDAQAAGGEAATVKLGYQLSGTSMGGELQMPLGVAQLLPRDSFDERQPDFVLDELDKTIINVNQADPNRRQYVWSGPEDLSVKVWLARSDAGLKMRVDVLDDVHVQPNPAPLMWKADGVQYALSMPGQTGHWEFGLGLNPEGEQAVTYMKPLGQGDAAEQFDLSISKIEGGLRYDVVMPYQALGLVADEMDDQTLGFNLIVNDDDGGGREGWAQIAEGIARSKNPKLFPLVIFE